jgi:hypothetical protein
MTDDVCVRVSVLEEAHKYNLSRMGEICLKLDELEEQQVKILQILIKIQYFGYGIVAFMFAKATGVVNFIQTMFF